MARSERDADTSNFVTTWSADNPPYVILKWTIQNLCCAETLLKSPRFEISKTSRWQLLLDPSVVVDGDEFIGIYLRSDSSDPKRFMLKGEISVHGPSNELMYDKIFEEIHDKNNNIEFRLTKLIFPVLPCLDDSYLVRCEMILSREINSVDPSRTYLQKLSMDYKNLYHDAKFVDISIHATDDIISSHKAFLHARVPFIATSLNEDATYVTENNEKNPYLAVILLFLYTGDPDLLLSSIPLEMIGKTCAIAKKWKINDLVNLLTPLRMHCKTHVKNECFQYIWEIKNFTKLPDNLHSSEFFTKEGMSARWRLTLAKSSRDTSQFYDLYLEKISSDNLSYKTLTEFQIYKGNDKENSLRRRREFIFGPRSHQKRGFSSIFDRNFVVGDDTLKIICILRIHLDSDSWIDYKSSSVDVSDKDSCFLKYLKVLSRNLKELYESRKYADLKLLTGQGIIPVHKAVLWARSPFFSCILSQYSAENVTIPIQYDIMNEMLLYMYSGELPIFTPLNMQNIYEASSLLKLEEVRLECKLYILLNITVDNVLEIMVLAHQYKDKELEESAEKFASTPRHAKMFLNTQRWRLFLEEHTTLAIKIYHNLSWSYCNNF